MRGILRLSSTETLDPFALAKEMGVKTLSPREIPELPNDVISHLLYDGSDGWSAGCLRVSETVVLIVYNPNHAATRQRATIMEELAHLYLNHKGSELISVGNGDSFRSYKKSEEKEAYWVGAAALVPRLALQNARREGISERAVAARLGVSGALVRFRENVTKSPLH